MKLLAAIAAAALLASCYARGRGGCPDRRVISAPQGDGKSDGPGCEERR